MREQLNQALEWQKKNGGTLGQALAVVGMITPEQLLQMQYELQTIDLAQVEASSDALEKVSGSLARQYRVVPVRFEGGTLAVAIADPKNITALDELQFILNCRVTGLIATPEQVAAAIERYYG